ncbi:MAG: MBL fold metallo-hydrolase [Candidatus Dormibacteria bacterium]
MSPGADALLVRAPNPGPLTGQGTNTWIFGRGQSVVIDPGPADEGHLDRVLEMASRIGRVAIIACTHHHLDHLEGAERLCQLTGAPLALHFRRALAHGELPLHDGDRLLVGDSALLAVHTPGHASDHVCFFDEESRVLFTGDHVLQGSTSLVVPPDGDMAAYLESLERTRGLGASRLLPGHGEPIEDAEAAIRELVAHRLAREQQILGLLRRGPATAPELVPAVYPGYPDAVLKMAAGTLQAHLEKLEREGRARRLPGDGSGPFELVGGAPPG